MHRMKYTAGWTRHHFLDQVGKEYLPPGFCPRESVGNFVFVSHTMEPS